ncbi:hypothetical protein FRC06_004437 [Ceratobasidium sp. 370]|nr:hypothetical protein FRC06_004437 [Ceratobasidium sp. 370]
MVPLKDDEKEKKVVQLKGKDAEDAILRYLKKVNRPYGSCMWLLPSYHYSWVVLTHVARLSTADISANLGNTVSKPAAQKILLALAERGAITQKTYGTLPISPQCLSPPVDTSEATGKATYFVALQTEADALPAAELAAAKAELERAREVLKEKQAEVKRLTTELSKIRAVLTDAEIEAELADVQMQIDLAENALEPLRAGCRAPVSEVDLAKLDAEWMRWRNEWVARRKVFKTIWEMRTDTMSKDEGERLMEDLGIEMDTPEHLELERSALCMKPGRPTKSTVAKR